MKLNGILLLSLTLIFGGCDVKDNSSGIPHIVKVNNFNLSTNYVDEGSDTHDVNEVWVYSSQDVLGVFPLPATIPYLDEDGNGTVDITILAGIKANGIAATRTPYNFYEAESLEVEFHAGDTTVIETFDTQYSSSASIKSCEDFESTCIFNPNIISSADIIKTTNDEYVLDGEGSGLILLNDSMNQLFSSTETSSLYDLQSRSGEIWLEYDYKSDNTFSIGLEAIEGTEDGRYPIYVHNSTGGECKKMYLELGPIVWATPGAKYKIILDAILDPGEDSGYIVVDNFKIVSF